MWAARRSASRAPGRAVMSTRRVVLTAAQASRGVGSPAAPPVVSRRAEVRDRRRNALGERRAGERPNLAVEAHGLQLRRERQRLAAPGELGPGHDGADLRDELLDRRGDSRRVVHRCAGPRLMGCEEKRASDVRRVVVLGRAREADLVWLSPDGREHRRGRARGHSLVTAGAVDDVRAKPDRGEAPRRPHRPAQGPRRRASRRRRGSLGDVPPLSGAGEGSEALIHRGRARVGNPRDAIEAA